MLTNQKFEFLLQFRKMLFLWLTQSLTAYSTLCYRISTFWSISFYHCMAFTSVSNWAPNMSIGLPLASVCLCLSSQSLKEKGDITFMVFSWNGGSLNTSSVHPKGDKDSTLKYTATVISNPHFKWTLKNRTYLDQVFLFYSASMPWTCKHKVSQQLWL